MTSFVTNSLVFEELEKGVLLREVVAEILRDGAQSISQVGKALRQRGVKLHRLAVAGYLKALADSGFLEEREIPPAKVYALKPGPGRRDFYRSVADACRQDGSSGRDPARVYLQALVELLRRPVFREELKRGGFEPPSSVQEIEGEERGAARRFLSRTTLKLPFNNPAYRNKFANQKDEGDLRDEARGILAAMLREEFHAGALAMTTKQATLGGDA